MLGRRTARGTRSDGVVQILTSNELRRRTSDPARGVCGSGSRYGMRGAVSDVYLSVGADFLGVGAPGSGAGPRALTHHLRRPRRRSRACQRRPTTMATSRTRNLRDRRPLGLPGTGRATCALHLDFLDPLHPCSALTARPRATNAPGHIRTSLGELLRRKARPWRTLMAVL